MPPFLGLRVSNLQFAHLMKIASLLVATTLLPIAASAQIAPVPDQNQVVPGERIGRVFIGDTRAAVQRRLGKPSKTFRLPAGRTSELWRGSKREDTGRPNTLEVIFERGVAIQIETTNPVFRTKSGLSVLTGSMKWLDVLRDELSMSRRRYVRRGSQTLEYNDWQRLGIALELIEIGDGTSPETLIVHRKNHAVIPDPGGKMRDFGSGN